MRPVANFALARYVGVKHLDPVEQEEYRDLKRQIMADICDRIAAKATIRAACVAVGIDEQTPQKWIALDEAYLAPMWDAARAASALLIEEQIAEIAEQTTAKTYKPDGLKIETLKWQASIRNKKYRERLDVTSDGEGLKPAQQVVVINGQSIVI